ncbi:MAG: membrane protein insertion efficiency factor YidD, partial [Acidobacteria bacterium]|nr:membrane protein insertion efficiency factor YidD [Acidobacteriota bacterium]
PTCSCYASEAVERWGLLGGLKLTLRRLLQCRPLGGFGYDPVPDVRQVLRHPMPQVGGSE